LKTTPLDETVELLFNSSAVRESTWTRASESMSAPGRSFYFIVIYAF
jgi:hypothetical protein